MKGRRVSGQAVDEVEVQRGVDPARRDGVAANPERAFVHGDGAGQAVQASLGRSVGGMAGVRRKPLDTADVDDSPAAVLAEQGQGFADQQERQAQVQVHLRLPVCFRAFLGGALEHQSGVVHDYIQPVSQRPDLRHDGLSSTRLKQIRDQALAHRRRAALGRQDAEALGCEAPGDGLADAAGGAGDQRGLLVGGDIRAHATGLPPLTSSKAPTT